MPDHSADAVRYVLTAANQGQHNFQAELNLDHIIDVGKKKPGVYANGGGLR